MRLDSSHSSAVHASSASAAKTTSAASPKKAAGTATFASALKSASTTESGTTSKSSSTAKVAETTEKVAGHAYADILTGPRSGLYLNTSGNARDGEAFVMVKRNGREYHIYGTGHDRKVVGLVAPEDRTKTASSTTSQTPSTLPVTTDAATTTTGS